MPGRRCSICCITFPGKTPSEKKWKICAQCGEGTDYISNAEPTITDEEATSVLRHREFEEFIESDV